MKNTPKKQKKYAVILTAYGYPEQGYYLDTKIISNISTETFRDSLPPNLIDYVIVDTSNKFEAAAIGLMQLYQKAKKKGAQKALAEAAKNTTDSWDDISN